MRRLTVRDEVCIRVWEHCPWWGLWYWLPALEASWFLIWALVNIVIAARTSNVLSGHCNQGQWPLTLCILPLAHTFFFFLLHVFICVLCEIHVLFCFFPVFVKVIKDKAIQALLEASCETVLFCKAYFELYLLQQATWLNFARIPCKVVKWQASVQIYI